MQSLAQRRRNNLQEAHGVAPTMSGWSNQQKQVEWEKQEKQELVEQKYMGYKRITRLHRCIYNGSLKYKFGSIGIENWLQNKLIN